MSSCLICEIPLIESNDENKTQIYMYKGLKVFECPTCSKYSIWPNEIKDGIWEKLLNDKRGLVRGLLYHDLIAEREPLSKADLNVRAEPTIITRAEALLKVMKRLYPQMGNNLDLRTDYQKFTSASYSKDKEEMKYIANSALCSEYEFLESQSKDGDKFKISTKGWIHLANPKMQDSRKIFVAMWFDDSLNAIYDKAIVPAIESCNYQPVRIDHKDHTNKICDEIIAEIKASKCLIADFTGHRSGVYYEAGYAHGRGLPVIFTCKDKDMNNLHFDIRQYNCIFWKKAESDAFKKALTNRIKAVLDQK